MKYTYVMTVIKWSITMHPYSDTVDEESYKQKLCKLGNNAVFIKTILVLWTT